MRLGSFSNSRSFFAPVNGAKDMVWMSRGILAPALDAFMSRESFDRRGGHSAMNPLYTAPLPHRDADDGGSEN